MSQHLPKIVCILCLLVGLSVGWYFGYTRPSMKSQRKLLEHYQLEKDNFHMADADMADFAAHKKEYFEAMKREDEMAAAMAFGALLRLERGDIEKTRNVLERTISIYVRGHRYDGDSNILRNIEIFAATNASLSNAIYRKLD